MKVLIRNMRPEIFIYPAYALLVLATARLPFFWDTIQLASRHANFFFDTDFRSIILPHEMDSGHIPSLGIYLAAVWKIFGRSLFASHIAMLPFILGIVWQMSRLVRKFIPEKWQFAAMIILLLDPTLLAQCTLVSPDVLLVFFFLMALNNLSEKNRIYYGIALAGLTLSSMRGMMCVAGLFCTDIIITLYNKRTLANPRSFPSAFLSNLLSYLPALFIAGLFFGWHYYKTGWIGYHKGMPWYPFFETVDFKGAIYNTFILGWRLIDFGHLFIWITALFCFWNFYGHRPSLPYSSITLSIILITIFLSIAHAFILHRNLSMHRYLLPVYIVFTLLVLNYLYYNTGETFPRKFFTWLLIIGLLTGNFWVYPDRIAKGWDSSLAYIPYFSLRKKMMDFMDKNSIKTEETGTCFPNTGVIDRIDLSGNMGSFADKDLLTNNYIFYSNIYNDFSDDELLELKGEWQQIKEFRLIQVKIILYKNPQQFAK
jgi:hypothetical protein